MMRVVVIGATGNAGTSLVNLLSGDERVDSIVGVARRTPSADPGDVKWHRADISVDDLRPVLEKADTVVHLAWAIQPSRDVAQTDRINVEGSRRVFEAAAHAGVKRVVYASSVGAYSPSDKNVLRDETWPTGGIKSSFYSRQKAEVEGFLDQFEKQHSEVAVVRLRPALMFKREAASEIRRLFFGPLIPSLLFNRKLLPLIPFHSDLMTQVVHSADVAEAFRLCVFADARGAYNLATEPIVTAELVEKTLGARSVKVNPALLRRLADATWKLRMQPTPPGWVDMGTGAPLMDTGRATSELGWTPRHDAQATLLELLEGLRTKRGTSTPPLASRAGGFLRRREFRSGVGRSNS
jgi:UDP-glucose 4-epimerase